MKVTIHRALALAPLSILAASLLLQAEASAQSPAAAAPVKHSEYLVFSQCKPGLKAQCDEWYGKHIQDLLKLPGMMSAQQYTLTPAQRGGMNKDKDRLVIYQIDGDPDVVLAQLRPAVNEGRLQAPDPALFEMTFQTAIIEKSGAPVQSRR